MLYIWPKHVAKTVGIKKLTEKKCTKNNVVKVSKGKMENVFPAGLEPVTFRVLGGRDNHYTTETSFYFRLEAK